MTHSGRSARPQAKDPIFCNLMVNREGVDLATANNKGLEATVELRSTRALDGIELQYGVVGKGPPVVMLHGILSSRSVFSRQFPALAGDYRIILPSARGHDSTDATLPSDYGIDTSEVRDVVSVLEAEGLERIRLIGHSSGGAVAYSFARKFPELVERLVLIEPTLLNLLTEKDLRPFTSIIGKGKSDGDMAALRATLELAGGDAWARLDEETKSARLDALGRLAPILVPHWQALLRLTVTPADLQSLSPPTLLLYGTKSYAFESIIANCWRETRPDLKLIEVEGAGHNLYRERPDIVNPALVDFLAGGA